VEASEDRSAMLIAVRAGPAATQSETGSLGTVNRTGVTYPPVVALPSTVTPGYQLDAV
jgi:hypothetical protein